MNGKNQCLWLKRQPLSLQYQAKRVVWNDSMLMPWHLVPYHMFIELSVNARLHKLEELPNWCKYDNIIQAAGANDFYAVMLLSFTLSSTLRRVHLEAAIQCASTKEYKKMECLLKRLLD